VFAFRQTAASGWAASNMAIAAGASTRYPSLLLRRPVIRVITKAERLRGPLRTPTVLLRTGSAEGCANGRMRPTHFSRTHAGASPGGTKVTWRWRLATGPNCNSTTKCYGARLGSPRDTRLQLPLAYAQCTGALETVGSSRGYERRAWAKKILVIQIVSVSYSTPAGGARPSPRINSGSRLE